MLPRSQKIARWVIEDDEQPREKTNGAKWAAILNKVFVLDYKTDEQSGEKSPHLLRFDREAKVCLYGWQNTIIDASNDTDCETEGESRRMKHNTHVVRLALLLQVLRYACGEGHLNYVDAQSMKGAIRLNDYFEDSLQRIHEAVANDICDEPAKDLLSLLGNTFGTAEAIEAGRQMRVSERSVMNFGCQTSTCGSACSDNTCSRYIPTKRFFSSRAKKTSLLLHTICPMSVGSLLGARTDASMPELSRRYMGAMSFFCPTSERPMLGGRSCQSSNPFVGVFVSV